MMKTELVLAGTDDPIAEAVNLLMQGEVIAIPTDTVYGVAADGLNPLAIEKLYVAKDRPRDKAIPLLCDSPADLKVIAAEIPEGVRVLAERFWPGALTLIVKARPEVPAVLRAEGDSVAVRVPDHPIPRALARQLGRPLAATSANISGGPDPSTAQEVLDQLGGRIPLVLDGGRVGGGVPSTVVDFSVTPARVLRVGALAVRELEDTLGTKLVSSRS